MRTNRYPDKFKREIVQKVLFEGKSISQTARINGVSICSIRAWVKDYKYSIQNIQQNKFDPNNENIASDDIEKLRSLLNIVTHERDTLRTALVILARNIGITGTS
mgnify:CR=1 FL=1|tara:strand:- start:704 stop:1018 length:315 start_codon:yes stop_codon:yes gene_type:complete